MQRNSILWGIIFALIAVLLGAFGVHVLKPLLSAEKLAVFETGVKYQFMHAMALIAFSLYTNQMEQDCQKSKAIKWVAIFFIVGTFLFSGSLYGLVWMSIRQNAMAALFGPITPLGGLCFMLGWTCWGWIILKNKVDK